MFNPTHLPNKLEIFLSLCVVAVAAIATGIIFPLLISTDKIPLAAIISLFILIFFLLIVGLHSILNFFYKRWQDKNVSKSNKHRGRPRSK